MLPELADRTGSYSYAHVMAWPAGRKFCLTFFSDTKTILLGKDRAHVTARWGTDHEDKEQTIVTHALHN